MAERPPSLVRQMSQSLVNNLVGAPNTAPPEDPLLPGNTGGQSSQPPPNLERTNLERTPTPQRADQTAAERNREAHEEAQRAVVAEMVLRQIPMMCFMLWMFVVFIIATIWIYWRGVDVYTRTRAEPCDQPLKPWLLTMLLIPLARFWIRILQRCPRCQQEQINKFVNYMLLFFNVFVYPALLILGFIWMLHSKTCYKTDPELYTYLKIFFAYHVFQWVVFIILAIGFFRVIVFLHASGILDQGPGKHMAGRPGLISELETVEYNPNLFDSPECCVCQADFDAQIPIKKTPCGHFFHEECLGKWLENYARTCPICRRDLEQDGQGSGEP